MATYISFMIFTFIAFTLHFTSWVSPRPHDCTNSYSWGQSRSLYVTETFYSLICSCNFVCFLFKNTLHCPFTQTDNLVWQNGRPVESKCRWPWDRPCWCWSWRRRPQTFFSTCVKRAYKLWLIIFWQSELYTRIMINIDDHNYFWITAPPAHFQCWKRKIALANQNHFFTKFFVLTNLLLKTWNGLFSFWI